METFQPKRIFLSYAHVDAGVVARLHDALSRCPGLTTWFDTNEMDSFDNIARRLEDGLGEAHVVVACLSRAYVTRPACMWEITELLGRVGEDHLSHRLLVVEVDFEAHRDPSVPRILGDALVVETLPPAEDEAGLRALAEKVLARAAGVSESIGSLQTQAPFWYPFEPMGATSFKGRSAEMLEIHAQLTGRWLHESDPGHRAPAWVIGMGGSGKTLLVERYAARFGRSYPGGVVRIRAGGEAFGGRLKPQGIRDFLNRYEYELRTIADTWGIDLPSAQPLAGTTPDEALLSRISAIRGRLRTWPGWQRGRVLWMLDDVPGGLADTAQGMEALRALSAPHPAGVTLATTRALEYATLGEGEHLALGMLDEETALAVLNSHYKPRNEDEREALKGIHAALGGHPLAIDVTGMRLRSGTRTAAHILADLTSDLTSYERLAGSTVGGLPSGHGASIVKTLVRSIELLSSDSLMLLAVIAELRPAVPVPWEVLSVATRLDKGVENLDWAVALRDKSTDSAVRDLIEPAVKDSLVAADGDAGVSMHALVGVVVRSLTEGRATRLAGKACNAVFDGFDEDVTAYRQLDKLLEHGVYYLTGTGGLTQPEPSRQQRRHDLPFWRLGDYAQERHFASMAADLALQRVLADQSRAEDETAKDPKFWAEQDAVGWMKLAVGLLMVGDWDGAIEWGTRAASHWDGTDDDTLSFVAWQVVGSAMFGSRDPQLPEVIAKLRSLNLPAEESRAAENAIRLLSQNLDDTPGVLSALADGGYGFVSELADIQLSVGQSRLEAAAAISRIDAILESLGRV